jgi:hypothetical protein
VSQHHCGWRDLPGHRHGKRFIGRPCKKRADDLLKLSRHQLKIVVAILTGHAPVRKHIRTVSLIEGDPTCRFCKKEAETPLAAAWRWLVSALMSLEIQMLNQKT